MKMLILTLLVSALCAGFSASAARAYDASAAAPQATPPTTQPDATAAAPTTQPDVMAAATQPDASGPLGFTMEDIQGRPVPLSKYRGRVVLMVNVASRCGYTPQYKDLEALHEKYADKGLAVLGFPANEFGRQEPGTNEQILQFCTDRYDVKFDMFAKVVVKGEGICPLYRHLTEKATDPEFAGPIRWNFTKFLIGRNGRVVARFDSGVKPSDPRVVAAIEKELAAKP
ncbi:MAG: hypothetical protein BIFFINMI_03616 [Phycisphaerae bacterium]|nr:hypothetical protein [Phycisphaerae bacterium]